MPLDEGDAMARLMSEVGLKKAEAELYLKILKAGSVSSGAKTPELSRLVEDGMVILSGDNSRFIPVHPRLAIANHYRTWREKMVKEISDRRMRVDRLILQLIPVYEAAAEEKLARSK